MRLDVCLYVCGEPVRFVDQMGIKIHDFQDSGCRLFHTCYFSDKHKKKL